MREHSVWVWVKWLEQWQLIASFTYGLKPAVETAQEYKRRHPYAKLRLIFPDQTYTDWP